MRSLSFRKAYTILAQAQPFMLDASGMQDAFKIKLDPDLKMQLNSPRGAAVEFDVILHKDVRFWGFDTYKPYSKRGSKAHLGKADGVDIYLERLDGTVISKTEYSDLRLVLKRLLSTLQQNGAAAPSWRQLSHEAYAYMSSGLRKAFAGFDYCEKGWKLDLFGMLVYPDYVRERDSSAGNTDKAAVIAKTSKTAAKGKKRATPEACGDDSDIEILEDPPNKRPKTSGEPLASACLVC